MRLFTCHRCGGLTEIPGESAGTYLHDLMCDCGGIIEPALRDDEPLDVGSLVLYRGKAGRIVDATPEMSGPPSWWVVEFFTGGRAAPLEGDPNLKRLTRANVLRSILDSVADRRLPVERAARVIELFLTDGALPPAQADAPAIRAMGATP